MKSEPDLNIVQFWQRFTEVEKKTRALDFKVLRFQMWPLLRTKIFYQIASQIGLFDNPHPNPESFRAKTATEVFPIAKTVLIPFQRKVNGIDPYSQLTIEQLSPLVLDFESEDGFDVSSLRASFPKTYPEQVARAMRRLDRKSNPAHWQQIISGFESEFHVEIQSYREYPKWFFRRSLVEAFWFRKIFSKMKTKKLYLVNAYSHPTIVLGAKLARVKTYELQHGFISSFHPAYSYPGNPKIMSMPNVLLSWGDYWNEAFDKASNLKCVTLGASKDFLQSLQQKTPKKDQVLFSSQGAIGKSLFEIAEAFAKNTDKTVIFRLHPNENPEDYISNYANLSISHKSPKFLDLIAQSEYLVGGFSTTMFEGLAFGCKVIVAPVSGYENLLGAIQLGEMTLLKSSTAKDIAKALEKAQSQQAGKYYSGHRVEALDA